MRQGDCAFQISGQLPGTEHCLTFLGGLCCWGNSQFTASEGTPSSLAPVFCSSHILPGTLQSLYTLAPLISHLLAEAMKPFPFVPVYYAARCINANILQSCFVLPLCMLPPALSFSKGPSLICAEV